LLLLVVCVLAGACSGSATQSVTQPQVTAEESPWKIESENGLNEYGSVIDKAIAEACGQTSEAFPGNKFRGISLGEKYISVEDEPETGGRRSSWMFPVAAVPSDDSQRPATVRVIVEAQSERIVGVYATYRVPIAAMVKDITAVFGKTSQELDSRNGFDNIEVVTLKYTFPRTVVRVTGTKLGTSIVVLDREFVEASLRPFANAVLTACEWIKQEIRHGTPVESGSLPKVPLADLKSEWTSDNRRVIMLDEQVKEVGRRRKGQSRKQGERALDVQDWDVAVAWSNGSFVGASVDLIGSPSVGMPALKVSSEHYMLPTLASTRMCKDLFHDLANVLVQQEFPPAGDRIRILSPKKIWEWERHTGRDPNSTSTSDESVIGRSQGFTERSFEGSDWSRCNNWIDETGCTTFISESCMVSAIREVPKEPRGL
jgi:hypothetical protein